MYGQLNEPIRNVVPAWGQVMGYRSGMLEPTNPVAQQMIELGMSNGDIIRHIVGASRLEPLGAVVDRFLGSDDLKQSFVLATSDLITVRFNAIIAWIWSLVRRIPVSSFRPERIPTVSGDGFFAQDEFAEARYRGLQIDDPLEVTQLSTLGGLQTISRQAIINDDNGAIASLADETASAAGLQMQTSLVEKLEASDTLADGLQFFNLTSGNLVSTGGSFPSMTSLDQITTKLYRATKPKGGIAAALPRFILTPPELMTTVRTLLWASFNPPSFEGSAVKSTAAPLGYATLPFTSATAWYVLADPNVTPALGILTLEGAQSPLTIESRKTPIERDGVSFKATLDYKV
ncbi:MAG: hypothetical protein K2X97_20540, partial [Mycobacteriaceae bacterium]|nr:hypothetical protein [Mycobacteriaceae bacterium]